MRTHLLLTLVTISPAHPAKVEVLLTFKIANFNLPKKTDVFVFSASSLVMKSMQPTQLLFIATMYRPYTAFLTEILSDLVVIADNIHIFGD